MPRRRRRGCEDMKALDRDASDDKHDDVPPRKRMKVLELRAENILEQAFKPSRAPWLRSDTKKQQRPCIMSLPTEIMQNIFKRLCQKEIRLMGEVCKEWLSLVKDPILNTSLTIKKEGPSAFYCDILRSSSQLRELKIIERQDLKTLLQIIKKHNPLLEVLKIEGFIPDSDDDYLCHGKFFVKLKHFTNLKVLSLRNVTMRHKQTVIVFAQLDNLRSLELVDCNLNFSFLDVISSSGIKLEEFVYRNIFISFVPHENSFETFFKRMGPRLKVLKLSMPALLETEMHSIVENSPNLNIFELGHRHKYINITSLQLLGTLNQLQCLNLYEVQFVVASSWCSILSQPALSNLKSLGLSFSTFLEDSVFETIGNNMKQLESAALNCRHAGESGLQHIIKNCSRLTSLTLAYINSRTITQSFPLIPECLPMLQVLSFRPTGFYNEHTMMQQIELMTPGLKINYIYEYADFLK